MTTIRPDLQSPPSPAASGAEAARLSAQRAFFAAARGDAAPSTSPTALPVPTPAAARTAIEPAVTAVLRPQRMPDPMAEPPTRVLRPGSLLDIRV